MEFNQRKYKRYHIDNLHTFLKVYQINNIILQSPLKTPIQTINIGLGGLSFFSNKDFPVRQDTLFQFDLVSNSNQKQVVFGKLVWKRQDQNSYQYGVEFYFENETGRNHLDIFMNRYLEVS